MSHNGLWYSQYIGSLNPYHYELYLSINHGVLKTAMKSEGQESVSSSQRSGQLHVSFSSASLMVIRSSNGTFNMENDDEAVDLEGPKLSDKAASNFCQTPKNVLEIYQVSSLTNAAMLSWSRTDCYAPDSLPGWMVEGNIEVSRKKFGLLNVELVHLLVHKCGGLCKRQNIWRNSLVHKPWKLKLYRGV